MIRNIQYILFFTFFCLIALSCKSFKRFVPPDPTTIQVKGSETGVDSYGSSGSAIVGIENVPEIHFDHIGQKEVIHVGEEAKLIISNVWLDEIALKSYRNRETNEIEIELIDKSDYIITLKKKCDVVEVRGIEIIPPIEITSGLNPEQIVITPLFDNNCDKIGYQIRYGSTERGCLKEGGLILNKFRNCVGKKTISKTKKKKQCLEEIWFGIKCP